MLAQIKFNYADRKLNISPKEPLKSLVYFVFKNEKKELGHINYIFCSDEFLLQINKNFLNHDYYTDIITFPLSEKEQPIEAEIYISIDRVKQNAASLELKFQNEILRVLVHGALHLCGYKDKSSSEIKKMRDKESFYINSFNKFHAKRLKK